MSIEQVYLSSLIKRCEEQRALGEKTFTQLDEAAFHLQPNNSSNSIAMVIQHLHGNMLSRWTNFLTEDGEKPWRNREEEFQQQPKTKAELLLLWEEGWNLFLSTIRSLQADDLLNTITIRSQPLVVVDALNRQLAHYSYHTGQIVYLGRWIVDNKWQSLSIPKGGSQEYNKQLMQGTK